MADDVDVAAMPSLFEATFSDAQPTVIGDSLPHHSSTVTKHVLAFRSLFGPLHALPPPRAWAAFTGCSADLWGHVDLAGEIRYPVVLTTRQ